MKGGDIMKKNNKGLSTVVTTLIIVLLVLVAIGLIWAFVLPLIQNSGTEVEEESQYLMKSCAELDGKICTNNQICANGSIYTVKNTQYCCIEDNEDTTTGFGCVAA